MTSYLFGIEPDEEKTDAERACRLLRHDIVSGSLQAGAKLKIDMLRDRYQIGAGPLREALARLAGDYLVHLIGQRGFAVSEISVKDAREIGNMRKFLESQALRESIPAGDTAWEERVITSYHRLERLERSVEQGIDKIDEWERLNMTFHDALVSACTSTWLLRLRLMMFRHHERYRRLSRWRTVHTRDINVEHRALMDAALDRDADRAAEVILVHIERTTTAVIAALQANETLAIPGRQAKEAVSGR